MAKAANRTNWWFALHGWMALPVWLFLFFVCLTGTLATVDREIMWLADSAVRAPAAEGRERQPLNRLVAGLREQVAGAHVNYIRFGEPYMALEVFISTPDRPSAVAWVDPFSGQVRQVATGIGLAGFIRALHGWLLMPFQNGTPLGWYAVCLMGLPLLGSVVTGLVVYKRFWRAWTAPRLRLDRGRRVAWGDFHRLAAVWSLWFIVVIALTGLWFLVRGVLYDLHIPVGVDEMELARHEAPLRRPGAPLPAIDLDQALAAVQAGRPGTVPLFLSPPEHALGTIEIYSRDAFPLLMEKAWVNPYSGAVLARRNVGNAGALEIISALNASLHYGNFAGLAVKLVWMAFGLLLTALVLSGTVVWTLRTARATRAVVAAAVLATGGAR